MTLTVKDDFIQTSGFVYTYAGTGVYGHKVVLDVTGTYHLNTGSLVLGFDGEPSQLEVTHAMKWGEMGGGKAVVSIGWYGPTSGVCDELVVDGDLTIKTWSAMNSTGAQLLLNEDGHMPHNAIDYVYQVLSCGGALAGAGSEDVQKSFNNGDYDTFSQTTSPWQLTTQSGS